MGAPAKLIPKMASKLLGEFLGTYLLIMAVGLNVSGGNPFGVTVIAFTLMVCIYALGDVSGANFNPAVSLALALLNKLPALDMLAYWCVQLVAGLAAATSFKFFVLEDPHAVALKTHESSMRPLLAEALFTCMLCLVVLSVAATEKNTPNQHYGLAIGLAIIGGGYASGPVSQGVLNPAVAVGLAMPLAGPVSAAPQTGLLLVSGELLGAIVAAAIYRILHPDEFDDHAEAGAVQKLVAEFVGTFYLVLTVALNVMSSNGFAAWSIAASLACMVYCMASVSGAHLNPAVTLSLIVRGASDPSSSAGYIPSQLLGGIAGAAVGVKLLPGRELSLGLGPNYKLQHACCAELLFTFVLTFLVLNIATVDGKKLGDVAGLSVGSCVTAGGFGVGRISGASLNPAVSVGLTLAGYMTKAPESLLVVCVAYVAAELVAGMLAAGVFKAVRMQEEGRSPEPQGDEEEQQPLLKDEKEELKGGKEHTV